MSVHDNITDPDLRTALDADDWAEGGGMPANDRVTCHRCQAWATPAHLEGDQHRQLLDGDAATLWGWL